MRIFSTLVVSSSLFLLIGCTYHDRESEYGYRSATPSGQVISSRPYGTTSSTTVGSTSEAGSPPVYSTNPVNTAGSAITQAATEADRALAGRVRQALNTSTLAHLSPNVNVYTQKGVVTLSGTVPTDQDRRILESMVRGTSGVSSINSQLEVQTATVYGSGSGAIAPTGRNDQPARAYEGQAPVPAAAPSATTGDIFNLHVQGLNETDRSLAQRILEGLQTDPALASLLPTVNINVANGRVVLHGAVNNEQQRQTISSVVRRAAGNNVVEDQLEVR
ncbi:MAG TPA: BON domain-containing protein [Clostridia bacterium]|nr:BON domain-containing protein [Clostridia bacterium]